MYILFYHLSLRWLFPCVFCDFMGKIIFGRTLCVNFWNLHWRFAVLRGFYTCLCSVLFQRQVNSGSRSMLAGHEPWNLRDLVCVFIYLSKNQGLTLPNRFSNISPLFSGHSTSWVPTLCRLVSHHTRHFLKSVRVHMVCGQLLPLLISIMYRLCCWIQLNSFTFLQIYWLIWVFKNILLFLHVL